MKKILLASLAALSLAVSVAVSPASAQFAPRAAHAQGGGKLRKIANELGLSDAQKAQLRPLYQSAHQQAQAIKADTTLTTDARKAKLKELARATRQQMLAILTPAQREKLKDIRQAHKNPTAPNA